MTDISDYAAPVYRSLSQPILFAGVPRTLALFLGLFTTGMVLNLQVWWFLPVGIGLHLLAAAVTRADPEWVQTLRRHMHYRAYYEG